MLNNLFNIYSCLLMQAILCKNVMYLLCINVMYLLFFVTGYQLTVACSNSHKSVKKKGINREF